MVATGDEVMLRNLRRICSSEALLEIIIGLNLQRDSSEMGRLELSPLSIEFIEAVLTPRYRAAGFEIIEEGILAASEWPRLRTTWAKRLRGNAGRSLTYIIALATGVQT